MLFVCLFIFVSLHLYGQKVVIGKIIIILKIVGRQNWMKNIFFEAFPLSDDFMPTKYGSHILIGLWLETWISATCAISDANLILDSFNRSIWFREIDFFSIFKFYSFVSFLFSEFIQRLQICTQEFHLFGVVCIVLVHKIPSRFIFHSRKNKILDKRKSKQTLDKICEC